jgi:hypothetical protein
MAANSRAGNYPDTRSAHERISHGSDGERNERGSVRSEGTMTLTRNFYTGRKMVPCALRKLAIARGFIGV